MIWVKGMLDQREPVIFVCSLEKTETESWGVGYYYNNFDMLINLIYGVTLLVANIQETEYFPQGIRME